jgi:hypothetical protein
MMMDMPQFVHYFNDGPLRHENLCCVYEVRLKGQLRLVHQMASMEGGSQAVDPIFWRREHLSAPVIVNISWSGQEDATDGVAKRSNEHCLVLRSLTRVAEDATGEDPPPRRGCTIGLGVLRFATDRFVGDHKITQGHILSRHHGFNKRKFMISQCVLHSRSKYFYRSVE